VSKFRDEDDAKVLKEFLLWLAHWGALHSPIEDHDVVIKSFLADRKTKQ
jgi:hypothetical protein